MTTTVGRSTCIACGSERLELFLELDAVPVHQDIVCDTLEEARSFPRGDLRLALCQRCGLLSNLAFQSKLMQYSEKYDNDQTHSPYYRDSLVGVAEDLKAQYHLRGKTVVDVGCGKGEFLALLCTQGVNRGIGVDPSYVGPDAPEGTTLRFVKKEFEPQFSDVHPDLMCCRHVLEHVGDPVTFLKKIHQVLRDSKDGVLYIETPNAGPILAEGRFWDVYYEHPLYFTLDVLTGILAMAGFRVVRQRSIFGNQYLAVEAVPVGASESLWRMSDDQLACLQSMATKFREGFQRRVERIRELVESFAPTGGCVLWGAAAKGVTIANTVDPEAKVISYLIDINPAKQNKFVPGSGHPIRPPDYLRSSPPSGVITVNPNYLDEVRAAVRQISSEIPILSVGD